MTEQAGEEPAGTEPAEPGHSIWLEVFFDLVVVAGVAQVAGLLREASTLLDVGIAACLFYALWSVWLSITMYSDVAGRTARTKTVLIVMFLTGAMAAAIPGVPDDGSRAVAFVVAFALARVVTAGVWRRTGSILIDWPSAQSTAGVMLWVGSIWVPTPWRYLVWALAIVLDVALSMRTTTAEEYQAAFRERQQEMLARWDADGAKRSALDAARTRQREQFERHQAPAAGAPTEAARRRDERRRARREREERRSAEQRARIEHVPEIAKLDPDHITERFGLFFVIVLGEAVAEFALGAAAQSAWTWRLGANAALAFALLIGIWWITLVRTEDGRPLFSPLRLPVRAIVPTHVTMLAALTGIAAGLGEVPGATGAALSDAARWLLCAGVAIFAGEAVVLISLTRATGRAARRGAVVRAAIGLPIAIIPAFLLGLLGAHVATGAIVAVLAAVIALLVTATLVRGRNGPARPFRQPKQAR